VLKRETETGEGPFSFNCTTELPGSATHSSHGFAHCRYPRGPSSIFQARGVSPFARNFSATGEEVCRGGLVSQLPDTVHPGRTGEAHPQGGDQLYRYTDMDKASLRSKDHHWLVVMLLTLGARNPTAVGQAAILASQDHSGIGIDMKRGKGLRIRLEAFQDPKKLLNMLKEKGVPLSPNLDKTLKKEL